MILAYDVGPARSRPTGVGLYVRELARALLRDGSSPPALIGARPDGPFSGIAATAMEGERHLLWVLRRANRDMASVHAELAHFTNAVAPPRTDVPYVLTIQDLSLVRYPHYHPRFRLVAAPFMAWAAARARRVIVPSEATANEVHRLLRVPARRIERTELAPAPRPSGGVRGSAAAVRELGVEPGGYVLSLATIEPRKNIARLVSAFELLPAALDLKLVLVGARGWRTAAIERRIAESVARDRIVQLGYVSDRVRSALLARCAVFAYVSLYEGYGLPIVEAMQFGAPVVASNVSSMPEAAGGAGILVDPRDPTAIASGIREALSSRADLARSGRRRAAKLSWDRVAAETRVIYELARPRPV